MSELEREEIDSCHSEVKMIDGSQSSLQTVLVTVSIEKPAAKNIKRVRFNSLVEVKFIPKCKSEKKKKEKSQKEGKEKTECLKATTKKTDHETLARRKDVDVKGELDLCAQKVTIATETSSKIEMGDSSTVKTPQSFEENAETELNLDKNRSTATAKRVLKRKTTNKRAKIGRNLTRLNGCAVKSRVTVRESYATNKVTLGGDYNGKTLRLSPTTFSVASNIRFSESPARNTKRKNFQEFGSDRALWRLEKQTAKFCEEAAALIAQVTENNADLQSHLKVPPNTAHLGGNYRQTFPTEHIKASFRKPSNVQDLSPFGKTASRDVFSTTCKPVTRLPNIKHKKQQSIEGLRQRSYSELCLPQFLLYDGKTTRSSLDATNDSKGVGTVKKASGKFELLPSPEEARNGNIVIQYSYGATKKLEC